MWCVFAPAEDERKEKEMFRERKDYGNCGPVRGQSTAC